MKRILSVLAAVLMGSGIGCSTFEVYLPDGVVVKTTGAPLLDRKDGFIVEVQDQGSTGTMKRYWIERQTEENSSQQVRMMQMMFEAGQRAGSPVP